MKLSDDELRSRAESELRRILDIKAPPLFTRLYRWEHANAQHEVGHPQRMAAIDLRLAAWPRLFVTGSGFRGVGIPDCIADARATGASAAAALSCR
jgi:oxygen-dependent protoporphyrinogen oxidase